MSSRHGYRRLVSYPTAQFLYTVGGDLLSYSKHATPDRRQPYLISPPRPFNTPWHPSQPFNLHNLFSHLRFSMPFLLRFGTPLARIPRRLPVCSALQRRVSTHSHPHFEKAVSVLPTAVDTNSPDHKQNVIQMSEITASLWNLHQKIALGGSEKAREKHLARNKMLPRE